jgi:hypothetical protein
MLLMIVLNNSNCADTAQLNAIPYTISHALIIGISLPILCMHLICHASLLPQVPHATP